MGPQSSVYNTAHVKHGCFSLLKPPRANPPFNPLVLREVRDRSSVLQQRSSAAFFARRHQQRCKGGPQGKGRCRSHGGGCSTGQRRCLSQGAPIGHSPGGDLGPLMLMTGSCSPLELSRGKGGILAAKAVEAQCEGSVLAAKAAGTQGKAGVFTDVQADGRAAAYAGQDVRGADVRKQPDTCSAHLFSLWQFPCSSGRVLADSAPQRENKRAWARSWCVAEQTPSGLPSAVPAAAGRAGGCNTAYSCSRDCP